MTSTTWNGPIDGSVSQTYDDDFRVATQSVSGGSTAAFLYDDDGLLIQAGAMTLGRSPVNGLLAGTTLASVTTSQSYNAFGELASDSSSAGYANTYTRDKLGRIVQKVETLGGVTTTYAYGYDLAGRFEQVSINGVLSRTYAYDANGNRLSVTDSATGTTAGAYDAQDRLVSYGSSTYTYNAAGDLTSRTSPAGVTQYQYDALGNLVSVQLPDGRAIEYVIDGQSRRVGKRVNGSLVQGFLYQDQLEPVAELDGSGNVVSRFVYGSRPNVPDYMVKGGATYRILSDHLGSPRLVVDASTGAVAQRIDYDEFGRVTLDTNPGFQPFGFAGGLYDADTGLTRFGARDYDPVVGRWTTKDPIRFAGESTNLFGYSLAEPINLADLDGHLFFAVVAGGVVGGGVVGAAIGGVVGAAKAALAGQEICAVLDSATQGAITGGIIGAATGGIAAGGLTLLQISAVSTAGGSAFGLGVATGSFAAAKPPNAFLTALGVALFPEPAEGTAAPQCQDPPACGL